MSVLPKKNVRKKIIKKKSISTIKKSKPKKKTCWMDEYKHLYTQRRMPISVLYLEALAKDLMDWGHNPDAYLIEQFYDEKGIDPRRPHSKGWFDACPELKAAHAAAKRFIGYRRELGMMHNQINVPATIGQMVVYSDTWRKVEEWRNDLKVKAKEDKAPNTFNITVPAGLITPKATEKKEEDE